VTPEKRIEAFRRMLEARPDEPFARYSLAMAMRAAGRGDEAVSEFEELRRRSPGYVPTYLMLGQLQEALGRSAEAARAYQDGIAAAAQAGNDHAKKELEQSLDLLRAQGT